MSSLPIRRSLIDPWHPTMVTVLPDAEFHLGLFQWDTFLVGVIIVAFVVMLMGTPIINY